MQGYWLMTRSRSCQLLKEGQSTQKKNQFKKVPNCWSFLHTELLCLRRYWTDFPALSSFMLVLDLSHWGSLCQKMWDMRNNLIGLVSLSSSRKLWRICLIVISMLCLQRRSTHIRRQIHWRRVSYKNIYNQYICGYYIISYNIVVLQCGLLYAIYICLVEVRAMVVAVQQPSAECTAIFTCEFGLIP